MLTVYGRMSERPRRGGVCVREQGESPGGSGIVLRHGTVLTMDESRQVLTDADVLVVGIGSPRSEPSGGAPREPGRSKRPAGSSCPA